MPPLPKRAKHDPSDDDDKNKTVQEKESDDDKDKTLQESDDDESDDDDDDDSSSSSDDNDATQYDSSRKLSSYLFNDSATPFCFEVIPTTNSSSPTLLPVGLLDGRVQVLALNSSSSTLEWREAFQPTTSAVRSLRLLSDLGDQLVVGASDGELLLLDVQARSVLKRLSQATTAKTEYSDPNAISALLALSESTVVFASEDGRVRMHDFRARERSVLSFHSTCTDYYSQLHKVETSSTFLGCGGDGHLYAFDARRRKQLSCSEPIGSDGGELTSICSIQGGQKVVVGSSDARLYIFKRDEYSYPLDLYPGGESDIGALCAIDAQRRVASATSDGIVRIIDLYPHRSVGCVGKASGGIDQLAVVDDSKVLLSLSSDGERVDAWRIDGFEDDGSAAERPQKMRGARERDEFFADLVK